MQRKDSKGALTFRNRYCFFRGRIGTVTVEQREIGNPSLKGVSWQCMCPIRDVGC